MLLGGSTGFGWGVADHHGIDKNLEKFLGNRTGKPVKVFNLSVPATPFSTENLVFRDFLETISPDVAVFYHGANDGLAWFEQAIGKAEKSQTLAPSVFSRAALLHLAYKSRVFRLLMEAVRPTETTTPSPVDVTKAVMNYETQFSESQRLCAATRCLYVIQPIIFNKSPLTTKEVGIYRDAQATFPQYQHVYKAFTDAIISQSFADHVDGRDVFSGSSEVLFMDFVHVTARGNEIMARFIADTLCARRYVNCRNLGQN